MTALTSIEHRCAAGHESAAPKPLRSCPHMTAGKPCPETVETGHWTAGGKWVAK